MGYKLKSEVRSRKSEVFVITSVIIIQLAFLLYSNCAFSQTLQNDVIASAGDSDTTDQVLVCWTVGECIVATHNNMDCMVTQGFQQSFYKVLEIPEVEKLPFEVKAYPNPAVDFIYVEVHAEELNDVYKIELTDMQGRIIQQYLTSHGNITRIDLRNISAGFLALNITHIKSKLCKSFKIVKTNY